MLDLLALYNVLMSVGEKKKKKISIAIFLPRVLMSVAKTWNFTSGGLQEPGLIVMSLICV